MVAILKAGSALWEERPPEGHVLAAVEALRPGRPQEQRTLPLLMWDMRLLTALHHLNLALAAANARQDDARKARVMRMANWVRSERRRCERLTRAGLTVEGLEAL